MWLAYPSIENDVGKLFLSEAGSNHSGFLKVDLAG
jgi:hypothetical protein